MTWQTKQPGHTVRTAKAWPVARCQLSKVHCNRLSDVVSGLAGEYGKVAARVDMDSNTVRRGLHSFTFRLIVSTFSGICLPRGDRCTLWGDQKPIIGGSGSHYRGVRYPLKGLQVPIIGGTDAHNRGSLSDEHGKQLRLSREVDEGESLPVMSTVAMAKR